MFSNEIHQYNLHSGIEKILKALTEDPRTHLLEIALKHYYFWSCDTPSTKKVSNVEVT